MSNPITNAKKTVLVQKVLVDTGNKLIMTYFDFPSRYSSRIMKVMAKTVDCLYVYDFILKYGTPPIISKVAICQVGKIEKFIKSFTSSVSFNFKLSLIEV